MRNLIEELLLPLFCCFICFCVGIAAGISTTHEEAVRSGVAHYVISNKESGETEFQWNTNNIVTNNISINK